MNRITPGITHHNPSAIDSLARHFQDSPTTPVDRRRVMQLVVGTGISALTANAVVKTFEPKKTREIEARSFVLQDPENRETKKAKSKLHDLSAKLAGSTSALRNKHDKLFNHHVKVDWEKYVDDETCTGEGEDEVCVDTSYWADDSSGDQSVVIDDGFILTLNLLQDQSYKFSQLVQRCDELAKGELKSIVGNPEGLDPNQTSNEDFIENFEGLDFKNAKVDSTKTGLISLLFGGLSLTGILFYKPIFDALEDFYYTNIKKTSWRNRNRYRSKGQYEVRQEEVSRTRREVLKLFGGLAGGATYLALEDYDKRSEGIQSEADIAFKETIIDGNTFSTQTLYERHFQIRVTRNPSVKQKVYYKPKAIIEDAIRLRDSLLLVSREGLQDALKRNYHKVNELEKRISPDEFPMSIRNVETTRKDDNRNNHELINAYIDHVDRMIGILDETILELEKYFQDGIPEALHPLLQSRFITDHINYTVAKEESQHLWGFSGDLALMYGAAGAIITLGEFTADSYEESLYRGIQGFFDAIDVSRMSVIGIFDKLKGEYSEEELLSLYEDSRIHQAIRENIETIIDNADDLEDIGVVFDPDISDILNGIYGTLGKNEKRRLFNQIKTLDHQKIIEEVYVKKALVYFAKKQTSLAGFKKAMTASDAGENLIKKPTLRELRLKTLELIENAGQTFVFDLIQTGILEDNEPSEDWITAEEHELEQYINYWSDRISASFAASTTMYVALGQLPKKWWDTKYRSIRMLTAEEVKKAFSDYIESVYDTPAKMQALKEEIARGIGKPVDEIRAYEISKRILLKIIKDTFESSNELEVIQKFHPELRAAFG